MVNGFVSAAVGHRICLRICSHAPCAQDQQVAVCVCGREWRKGVGGREVVGGRDCKCVGEWLGCVVQVVCLQPSCVSRVSSSC
jgi:hypothetical protein